MKEEACKIRFEELNARDVAIEKKETALEVKKNAMDELETGFMFQKDELEVKHAAMEDREEGMNQLEQSQFNDWEVGILVQT